MREEKQEREVRARKLELHTELADWWRRRRERNERLEREHRRQVLEEEELRREEVTVLRTHKQRAKSSSSPSSAAPLLPSIVLLSDKEMHDVITVADGRRDDRLRVEMNARRALEKLMTQRSFSRHHSLPRHSLLNRPIDSSRLPPLLPSPAFIGEEEKTALTIEPVVQPSVDSEDEAADSFPTLVAFPFEHPSDTDLRYRKVPLIVQGNPSRHTGISWRIKEAKLRAERVVGGVSPILPPAMVRKVRGREADGAGGGFGSTVARDRDREEKEAVSVSSGGSMWGGSGEDLSLVGKKQRAFLKKRRKVAALAQPLPPLHKPTTAQRLPLAHADRNKAAVVDHTSEQEAEVDSETTSVQPAEVQDEDGQMQDSQQQEQAEPMLQPAEAENVLTDEQAPSDENESASLEPADEEDSIAAKDDMQPSDGVLESLTEEEAGSSDTRSVSKDAQHVQQVVDAM